MVKCSFSVSAFMYVFVIKQDALEIFPILRLQSYMFSLSSKRRLLVNAAVIEMRKFSFSAYAKTTMISDHAKPSIMYEDSREVGRLTKTDVF